MKRIILIFGFFLISGYFSIEYLESHPLAPSLLKVVEKNNGVLNVLWKEPEMKVRGEKLRPYFQEGCKQNGPAKIHYKGSGLIKKFEVICKNKNLVGQEVGVKGWTEKKSTVLLHLTLKNKVIIQKVLNRDYRKITVPKYDSLEDFFKRYLFLGFGHIFEGLDHLMFVFGLIILMSDLRKIFVSLTFFTFGHSVTLSLASLNIISIPSFICEFAISLSLVFLVCEMRDREEKNKSLLIRYPGSLTTFFGLIHGLGFAGALKEVGLPPTDLPLTLFSFNLGIELGQLLFVLAIFLIWVLCKKAKINIPFWMRKNVIHFMGFISAFWCFERGYLSFF